MKCYELERELPFGVIGGMVNHLLDLPGANATAPEQLAELGRLVAKVRQRFPALPAPVPSVGEIARLRFTEAVMALVAAVAEEHPLVAAIDDIQLADEASLAVLHLLLRRLEQLPLMVVLTAAGALHGELPGARNLAESGESIALTQVHLGPLPPADATELLDALLRGGDDPGPTTRRAMLAGARGNPMVLELLVADWRRRGDACLALAMGAMTASAARRRPTPSGCWSITPWPRSTPKRGPWPNSVRCSVSASTTCRCTRWSTCPWRGRCGR